MIVAVGRAEDLLAEVVGRVLERGGEAAAVPVDVTDAAGREAVVATAIERFRRLDVLVDGAGVTRRVPTAQVTVEDYARVHAVNAEAALVL